MLVDIVTGQFTRDAFVRATLAALFARHTCGTRVSSRTEVTIATLAGGHALCATVGILRLAAHVLTWRATVLPHLVAHAAVLRVHRSIDDVVGQDHRRYHEREQKQFCEHVLIKKFFKMRLALCMVMDVS